MSYTLLVDFREKHENSKDKNIFELLEKNNIEFTPMQLVCGDFLLENTENHKKVVCERKIISDFVLSVFDGRLRTELINLENCGMPAFIILVGSWDSYYSERAMLKKRGYVDKVISFTVEQRLGTFASIACRYSNVKLLCVENDSQFLTLLPKLLEKSTDEKTVGDLTITRRKRGDNIFANMLCSFPTVSSVKASDILKKYPTFVSFFEALKKDEIDVSGIGEKTVLAFKKTFLGIN